jgi:hypothetical protein
VALFAWKEQTMAAPVNIDDGDACGGPVENRYEADIRIMDGPGSFAANHKLRGTCLTILVPLADDGSSAGLYRLQLDKHDPLLSALANLPTTVSGPPPHPGMPVVIFTVRSRGKEQNLVALRPPSDPRIDKILVELNRCQTSAKAAVTMALEVPSVVPTKPGQLQTLTVHVSTKGEQGAEVLFNPGLLLLQAAPEPQPAQPGVTPLPPAWTLVSAPLAQSSPQSLKAGSTLDVRLTVNVPASIPRWARVMLNGNVTFKNRDGANEVRASLSSKPVRLPAATSKK